MTDQQLEMAFDRDIRELFESGPRVAPPATLERALARAEVVSQRHARFARLDRRTWPPQRRSLSDPSVHRLARLAAVALAILLVGVVIAVGARLADRTPTPAPTLTPTPGPSFTLAQTIESAGTMDLRSRDHFLLRLWPDGRLLVGEEHLFDLATGATEQLAVALAPGANPSVHPLADGRVVLIYDHDIEGGMAQGQHRVAVLDPTSGAVTDVGRLPTWAYQQLLVLRDGRIFGSGGLRVDESGPGEVLDTAFVFDLDTGTTTQLGPLRQPRVSHALVELLDGRVLLMDGERPDTDQFPGPMTWLEVYDLETGSSTPVDDPEALTDGWGQTWPFALLGDGRVVLAGLTDITEPCPDLPRPTGGLIGGPSDRAVGRLQTFVFDPETGTLLGGPLLPRPHFSFVPLAGDRALLSRQERAFASCAADAELVSYPWLGIADFGSGSVLGSPNPVTGEGTLDLRPEAVYSSGVLLPDGRVALMEAPGDVPGPRRIDILTIDP